MRNIESKEQQLVNIMFQIGLAINDKNNRKFFEDKSAEETAKWIASQLDGCGFKTEPCGSSWGVLVNK